MSTSSLQLETQLLSDDLCALLQAVDPASFRVERSAEVHGRAGGIAARLKEVIASLEEDHTDARFERLIACLRALSAIVERATPVASPGSKTAWEEFRLKVSPAYESLAASLHGLAAPVRSVRPTNYSRNVFHVASGLTAFAVIALVSDKTWLVVLASAFALSAWTMETTRRMSPRINDALMRLFGRIAHPHEHYRVNSATWFATALLLLAAFFSPVAATLGVVVLAFGDPAAALIGRRFGRTRLRTGRSLEGTLAFVAAGFVPGALALVATQPIDLAHAALFAAVGAATGAVTELFSSRVDDNFTIPVSVACAVSIASSVLGG